MLNTKAAFIAALFIVGGASLASAQGRPEYTQLQPTHQQLIEGRSVYVAPTQATATSSYTAEVNAENAEGNGSNR